MFPNVINDPTFHNFDYTHRLSEATRHRHYLMASHNLYLKVSRAARLSAFIRRLLRKPVSLQDLSQVKTARRIINIYPDVHVHPVPIRAIQGSENRCESFDAFLRPLGDYNLQRWVGIATMMLSGSSLPAVELIKVNQIYYIRDGHHRVSVAKALGYQHIDALVTHWHTAEPTSVPAGVHTAPINS